MMSKGHEGALAELAIMTEALRLGIEVYKPCFEGGRYDLIFGVDSRLLRIHCKWATVRKNVVKIRSYSSRRGADGHIKRTYSSKEIDALAAYCPELERCFLVPISRIDGRPTAHLRIAPTRNNQVQGVNRAEDFDSAATLRTLTGP
jgi:hypothetical protein